MKGSTQESSHRPSSGLQKNFEQRTSLKTNTTTSNGMGRNFNDIDLNDEEKKLLSESETAVREVKAVLDGMNS